jgi:hypothetical protein
MTEIRHRSILANGIRMHIAEAGEGFPVVMCHGWPELWFSWRHQLRALSAAGFRAIAPDMRGYGETDAPADPAQYRTSVSCADIVGMLDVLGCLLSTLGPVVRPSAAIQFLARGPRRRDGPAWWYCGPGRPAGQVPRDGCPKGGAGAEPLNRCSGSRLVRYASRTGPAR